MDVQTKVSYGRAFEKQLLRVPKNISRKVHEWIFLVEIRGIWEVMKSKGLHDEPLKGARLGQRSVRMNRSYRLIYIAIEDRIHVELLEIHKHGY